MIFNVFSNDRSSTRQQRKARAKRRSNETSRQLRLEQLETRAMLSTSPAVIHPHQLTPPNLGILTLDKGNVFASLLHSGNGKIQVNNGDIYIDSHYSPGAGFDSGNGNVIANTIFVNGSLKHSGTGNFIGAIDTGAPQISDPIAGLPAPVATGPNFGTKNISSGNVFLSPGTYNGGIHISGNAHVTLRPGFYYIKGGGFSVSNNATVTGTGVTIFNNSGNTGITFSGTVHVTLTAPTSGEFQSFVLMEARGAKGALTVSGSDSVTLNGVVYMPSAFANFSGNQKTYINSQGGGTILGALIVYDLLVSGDGWLIVNAVPGGPTADLAITKTDDVGGSSIDGDIGSATPGGTITYTITVTNNGPSNVIGANISDTFPDDITFDSYTAFATGGATNFTSFGFGNIDDTVNMPIGSTIVYTITADISATATDEMSNTATVTVPVGYTDPDLTNNSATDTDTFAIQGDLSIVKSDDVGGSSSEDTIGTATPGSTITYTIVVSNSGPSTANGAEVADAFSSVTGLTGDTFTAFGSGGASGFSSSGSGDIDDFVTLPSGATITYTVTATIDSAATGSLSNTATVTAPGDFTDTDPTNNSATDNDTLVPQVDVSVTKEDNVGGSSVNGTTGSVAQGGTLIYTITVTNFGPSNAEGTTISDFFPSAISSDSFTVSENGGAFGASNGNGAIFQTVDLPSGSSIVYTVTANVSGTAPSGSTMGNTATVATVETNTSGQTSATDLDMITAGTANTAGIVRNSLIRNA